MISVRTVDAAKIGTLAGSLLSALMGWAVLRASSPVPWVAVAGFSHIRRFIAGASIRGVSAARHTAASRSSAMPCARRAMKFAVAGATRMRSHQRARLMWPMPASLSWSSSSVQTGRPDRAWKVSGETNSRAPRVITTCTSAPRSFRRRTRSALL